VPFLKNAHTDDFWHILHVSAAECNNLWKINGLCQALFDIAVRLVKRCLTDLLQLARVDVA
jgi:hypothetical protein